MDGRYEQRSVQDTSEDEGVFKCDALVVKSTVRKIGEITFTRIPHEGCFGRWTDLCDDRLLSECDVLKRTRM